MSWEPTFYTYSHTTMSFTTSSPWKHTDGVQIFKRNIRGEKRPTWEEHKCTTCLTAEKAVLHALVQLNIISNSCLTEVLAGMQSHNIRTAHVPYRTLAKMYPPPTQWAFVPPARKWTDMKVRVRIVTDSNGIIASKASGKFVDPTCMGDKRASEASGKFIWPYMHDGWDSVRRQTKSNPNRTNPDAKLCYEDLNPNAKRWWG